VVEAGFEKRQKSPQLETFGAPRERGVPFLMGRVW